MENKRQLQTILIIDDNEDDFTIYKHFLKSDFLVNYHSGSGDKLEVIDKIKPDLIMLDYNLQSIKGIDVIKTLKDRESDKDIPIIMLTGDKNPSTIIKCMKYGICDYLIKDAIGKDSLKKSVSNALLSAELKRTIAEKNKKIYELSITDDLTKVYNRRFLIEKINDEILGSSKKSVKLTIPVLSSD